MVEERQPSSDDPLASGISRRRLLTTGAAYQAAEIVAKGIALFTLPLYTRHVPRGEYGAYNTLLTTVYQTNPMYVNFSLGEQRLLDLQRELGRSPNQSNPSRRVFRVATGDG